MSKNFTAGQTLARSITRAASKQTDYTIRFLVDRDRVADAYQAYAYFRWVDDCLDQERISRSERLAFVDRQRVLVDRCYRGQWPLAPTAEERMLVELIQAHPDTDSGLARYVRNLMAVMAFDAERRGRLISQAELTSYTQCLAVAVTEALHYFIGHADPSPQNDTRYLAVTAAHVTHMLRDTFDDIAAGYFNVPREFREAHAITPQAVASEAYRSWVRDRVQLARDAFKAGKIYLTQVGSLRCRIAGYAYVARFEGVLAALEREDYRLRPSYREGAAPGAVLKLAKLALWQTRIPTAG